MKQKTPSTQRRRYVLATIMEYDLYLYNFRVDKTMAKFIGNDSHLDELHGRSPDAIDVVVLPAGWKRCWPRVKMDLAGWEKRWGGLGLEFIDEEELLGGLPVRQKNLLHKYDGMMEGVSSNYFTQAKVRDWIIRLCPQDQELLLSAQNERKQAVIDGLKKDGRSP